LADLQRTVYPHSGHPSAEGRAQDRVSSPASVWLVGHLVVVAAAARVAVGSFATEIISSKDLWHWSFEARSVTLFGPII